MEMMQKTKDGKYTMYSYIMTDADEGVEPLYIYTEFEGKTFCVAWNKKATFVYHDNSGKGWEDFYCMTCWGPDGVKPLSQEEALMYAVEGTNRAAEELKELLEEEEEEVA